MQQKTKKLSNKKIIEYIIENNKINDKDNENLFKCKKCKKYSLVDTGVEDNLFLCQDCGTFYEINYKTKRLVKS